MSFESEQSTPVCLEKSSVRNRTIVLAAFSVRIGLNKENMQNNDHTCLFRIITANSDRDAHKPL